MPNPDNVRIAPAEGKPGVLVPGPEVYREHAVFIQLMKLKNTLRWMRGEDLITHLGLEYYG